MMEKSKTIQIKLKTPIWTGNAAGKCDEFKETSLMGSIRWWFRIMLRTNKVYCSRSSQFNSKVYAKSKADDNFYLDSSEEGFKRRVRAQLMALDCSCPECLIFGTTGWKRQISIRVRENSSISTQVNSTPGWPKMMSDKVLFSSDDLTLELIFSRSVDKDYYYSIFVYLLSEIAKVGGICAKTQFGFGVFEIVDPGIDGGMKKIAEKGRQLLMEVIKITKEVTQEKITNENIDVLIPDASLPTLSDMFFVKFKLQKKHLESLAKNLNGIGNSLDQKIKYYLLFPFILREYLQKYLKEEGKDTAFIESIFGKFNHCGSRYHFSGIYAVPEKKWEMRFWGWNNGIEDALVYRNELIPQLRKLFDISKEEKGVVMKVNIKWEFDNTTTELKQD